MMETQSNAATSAATPAAVSLTTSNVDRALVFATTAHASVGQRRKYTQEPYIVHPIEVMMLVRRFGGNEAMQMAALLHDVVEDTPVTLDQLRAEFGAHVAELVDALTERPAPGNRAARKAAECARIAQAGVEAQTVKVADLVSNSATIFAFGKGFARVYAQEKAALLRAMNEDVPQGLMDMAWQAIPEKFIDIRGVSGETRSSQEEMVGATGIEPVTPPV